MHNREVLSPLLAALTQGRSAAEWLTICASETVPAGPVNDLAEVFESPQVAAHHIRVRMPHAAAAGISVDVIGTPLHLSRTPVTYGEAPPILGKDTGAIIARYMGLRAGDLRALETAGVIDGILDT